MHCGSPAECDPLLSSLEAKLTGRGIKAENIRLTSCISCIFMFFNTETSMYLVADLQVKCACIYRKLKVGELVEYCDLHLYSQVAAALAFSHTNQCYFSGMNGHLNFWLARLRIIESIATRTYALLPLLIELTWHSKDMYFEILPSIANIVENRYNNEEMQIGNSTGKA